MASSPNRTLVSAPPSRRTALRLGGAGIGTLALPSVLTACSGLLPAGGNQSAQGSAGTLLRSEHELPAPFEVPLPIPPVLEPRRSDGDTDHYEITQRVGEAEILPGTPTPIWGYEGTLPGPTLIAEKDRRTVVTHRNELPVPVVVHLHGGRTAPEHDGYPTDLILPVDGDEAGTEGAPGDGPDVDLDAAGDHAAGMREYVYEMEQSAATLWYHDHRMDFTGPQVYAGLAGFHLIHDEAEDALGLPTGKCDIPLMIMDRAFAADGSFLYPSVDPSLTGTPGVTAEYMSGVLGDCILVNGAPWPVLEVSATAYRFRLLNASNARRYRLRLEGGPSFVQVGSDMGLLATPVRHESLEVAQAERFDVVVDFSAYPVGTEITLINDHGRDGTDQVMRFVVARHGEGPTTIPDRLADLETLSEDDVVEEREIVFARGGAEAHGMTLWTVNGEPFTPETIIARPRLGTVERWTIRALNVAHPFHIHLSPFQVLATGGNDDPGQYNSGWKDTVNLGSGGSAEILLRFDGFRGKYVLHCHNLEHEDMMMMANFEVV